MQERLQLLVSANERSVQPGRTSTAADDFVSLSRIHQAPRSRRRRASRLPGSNRKSLCGSKATACRLQRRRLVNEPFYCLPGRGHSPQAMRNAVSRADPSATAALTVNGGAKATVSNSVFSGSTFGVDIEQANTDALVEQHHQRRYDRDLYHRGRSPQLSNSNVAFNITAVNGTISSFTNNRFVKNGGSGTILPIGTATSPTDLQ